MRDCDLSIQYLVAFVLALSMAGCGDDNGAADAASLDAAAEDVSGTDSATDGTSSDGTAADAREDRLSGVYNLQQVTCGGEEVPVMVMATVTFDGTSYLEEWTLPGSECEVTFAGTADATDEEVTLRDVTVTCGEACAAIGFCDPTHCSSDQTYQYAGADGELLLTFTQQGDEFSCGPCGDGVDGTYLFQDRP